MKNYEKTLPENYREVYHIDATDKRTGTYMTIGAGVLTVIPMIVFFILSDFPNFLLDGGYRDVALYYTLGFVASMFLYLVLHELVHGAVYKVLTGEKLTFGLKWSCAFCGVPNVYVYRRTALLSLCAPLVVFCIAFGALTWIAYAVDPLLFLYSGILLCVHIGGCVGDMYDMALLLFKYRQPGLLMNDTGPKQTFWLPQQNIDN